MDFPNPLQESIVILIWLNIKRNVGNHIWTVALADVAYLLFKAAIVHVKWSNSGTFREY